MKLKNIKKILDRIDPEIYPLWLENTLDVDTRNLDSSIDLNKGTTTLTYLNFIDAPFTWSMSHQSRGYWGNIDDIIEQSLIEHKIWVVSRLPYTTPYKFTKSWYFRKQGGRTCIAYLIDGVIMVYAGCFVGTVDQFERAARKRYYFNENENYAKHILWLRELELKYK